MALTLPFGVNPLLLQRPPTTGGPSLSPSTIQQQVPPPTQSPPPASTPSAGGPPPVQNTAQQNFTGGINFPYQNFAQQASAAVQGPPITNGQQYGRWNGVQNNAFGLAPSGWPSLYGYQAPQQGAWQPPWGNNGPTGGGPGGPPGAGVGGAPGQGGGMPPPSQGVPQGVPMQPGMDPRNFGTPPSIPQGGSTQPFNLANSVASQMQSATGQKFLANLSKYGQAGVNNFMSEPQTVSAADFNRIAQTDPTRAGQLAMAGGQQFQNALMQGNGWNPYDMNSYLNKYNSGAEPGLLGGR